MRKVECICDGCGRTCDDNYLTVSVGGDKEYPKKVFHDTQCLYRFADFNLDNKIKKLKVKNNLFSKQNLKFFVLFGVGCFVAGFLVQRFLLS